VAERILHELPLAAPWQPVLARELARAAPEASAAPDAPAGDLHAEAAAPAGDLRAEVEERARELGLQRLCWPEPFPFDSELAMRVAGYAQQIGRAVPFAQAAFRQAFAGGRSLQEPDNVLIAAAACEMHPRSVLAAARSRSAAQHLARTTAQAAEAGVREVPAIVLPAGGAREQARVLQGASALEQALALLGSAA
jgi:predicted DsbA family dithiol-disulfide isomerase